MSKYNTEWFKAQMLEKDPSIEILSEYGGDKINVKCKCKICGYEWEDSPTHLKQGRGCRNCKKIKKRKELEKDFIERASKIHNNKYNYSLVDYIDQHTKVTIICPIHGEFEQIPNAHLRGEGCSKCSKRSYKYTLEEFIELARKVHGDKYDYSKVEYIDIKTPVTIICKEHGSFNQSPDNHINNGTGCPKCQLKSQTKLYEKLKESFPNEEILFEVGKDRITWLGLQRFDIYFPKYNIAIEYNGEQHYIPIKHFGGELGLSITKERDTLKRKKCKENNCALFEIKYNYSSKDYDNLIYNINKIINTL